MLGRTLTTYRRMVITFFAALVIWATPPTADAEHGQFFSILSGEYTLIYWVPNCANNFNQITCCYDCGILEGCTREYLASRGYDSKGSVIDNASLAHIHIATDYSVGGGGSGCGSCSAGSPSGGLPTLQLDRFHRFRDLTVPGSFAPGVFSVYDTKVSFYDLVGDAGVEKRATLFNPTMMGYQSFVDGDTSHPQEPVPADTLNGEYVSFVNNSSRALILNSGTIGSLTPETDLADADYAVQTGYNGNKTYFRIIDLVGDDETTLGDDLIVHLKLDETGSTTVAADSSGNDHDGTVTESAGDPEWTTGKVGGALDLDDSGDKIVLDTGTGGAYKGIAGENERTVALWVKTSMSTGRQALVSWGDDVDGEKFTLLVRGSGSGYPYQADGKLYLHVNDTDVDGWIYGDDIVADGEWHHVVVVLPETEGPANVTHCRLYVDGRLQGVSASREQEINTDTTGGTNVTIGSDHDGHDLTGLVDDVRIYDRALNEEEIIDLAIKTHDWAGRLERIEDRNGYGITLVYKDELDSMDPEYISPTEIAESPSRQWQIDTVTDAYGRVATFSYSSTQQGGRWAVDSITLPNGEDVAYTYTDGFLSGVALPDGTNSTFTRSFNTNANCTVLDYDDAAADGTHRRKEVYLTALVYVGEDDGFVVPQAANLIRMMVNAEDEVTYLNMPKSDGYMYVYEGGEKLKRVYLNTYESRVATSWSVDDTGPFDYDDVTFTGEPTYDRMAFTTDEDWYNREPNKQISRTGIQIDLDDYNDASMPNTRIWPDGTVTRRKYEIAMQGGNQFFLPTRTEDRLGRVTRSTYDSNGNRTSHEVGIANTEVYKNSMANPDDPPVDVNQAEYAELEWEYYGASDTVDTVLQPENLLESSTDANGNVTRFVYNANKLLWRIYEPDDTGTGDHIASTFTYEDNGGTARRLKTSVDAVGRETEFFYDERERVIMVQYHDDSTERTAFGNDTDGTQNLVVARQDRNGNVTTMEYDDHGRLTLRTTAHYTIDWEDVTDEIKVDLIPLLGTANPVNVAVEYTCTYLEGTNLTDSCTNRGEVTTTTYDYRLRSITRTSTPRDTVDLTTTTEYIDNRVFSVEDPYGRKTFNFYRDSDHALQRTVRATIPDPDDEPVDFDDVDNLSRAGTPSVPSANAEYLITDYDRDDGGQQVAVIDPRGVVHGAEFDSRGRSVFSIQAADEVSTYMMGEYHDGLPTTGLPADHAKSETVYDVQSNVTEFRSPRYFDSTDTEGEDEANATWTYTRRNLQATHTVAAGASAYVAYDATAVKVTESFTYYEDGRRMEGTDFRGNDWETLWHACCGRNQGSVDPADHGTIRNNDFYNNVVHTAVVEDLDGDITTDSNGLRVIATAHNPNDARTINESTTRYDARNRPIATTRWLVAQGQIEPNPTVAQPLIRIAGWDNVDQADGLTTQFLYDEDLTDGVGLDSAAGVSVDELGGAGSYNISIADLIDELEADAGVTTYFSSTAGESDGYAVAVINPEEEIAVRIMDGSGRTVASAILDPTDQTSPVTEPITWSTTLLDAVVTVTGLGDCLETERHDALNHIVRSRTDGSGRTIETEDAENNDTVFEYDANSNRLSVRDPNSVGLDCDFNNRNLDISCTDTENDETQRSYNKNNNVVTLTDAKDEDTTCSYDARGRRYECTDRVSSATNQRFDENSNLLRLTDGESQETDYTYNDRNLRIETEWPDHTGGSPGDSTYGITEVNYDAARRAELATDQLGDTCTYVYDLANRLEQKDYRLETNSPSGTIADSNIYSWDDASRMLTAESERYSNTCTLVYDDVGRTVEEELSTHSFDFTVENEFDDANRRTKITYPDDSFVDREYTDRNQLETIDYTGGSFTAFETLARVYDVGHRLTDNNNGNGIDADYTYRDDNLTDTIVHIGVNNFSNGSNGLDFTYDYDENKNKVQETISAPMDDYGFNSTTDAVYDDEDRLIEWNRDDAARDLDWDLSLVGDWDKFTQNTVVETRTHTSAHELTLITTTGGGSPGAFTYDAKGNITQDTTKSPDHNYTWDFDNQLSEVAIVSRGEIDYTYDALGRRVSKTFPVGDADCTIIFVCSGHQVLAEYKWEERERQDSPGGLGGVQATPATGISTSSATAKVTLLRKYQYTTYIDDRCVMVDLTDLGAEAKETEELFWYHVNNLFSVAALSDEDGDIVERYAYDAYGNTLFFDAASTPDLLDPQVSLYGNEYLYTGQRLDAETGLYHYKRRYYDTTLGRFISRDPIFNLNLYAYVGGHPLSATDPSGLILLAIDGTNSEEWLGSSAELGGVNGDAGGLNGGHAKTRGGRWLYHTANFYLDYRGTEKRYMHGPDWGIGGSDSDNLVDEGYNWVCREWCRTGRTKAIDLIGHSRGAVLVRDIAARLEEAGCCCSNGTNYQPVGVRFLGLYDPVDMTYHAGEEGEPELNREAISGNVRHFATVFATRFPNGGRLSKGGPGSGSTHVEWDRPAYHENDWEVLNSSHLGVPGNHGGIGGAPGYDTHPPFGYRRDLDIQSSIEADQFIRSAAITAGVPIGEVDDYDFDDLIPYSDRKDRSRASGSRWHRGTWPNPHVQR